MKIRFTIKKAEKLIIISYSLDGIEKAKPGEILSLVGAQSRNNQKHKRF